MSGQTWQGGRYGFRTKRGIIWVLSGVLPNNMMLVKNAMFSLVGSNLFFQDLYLAECLSFTAPQMSL